MRRWAASLRVVGAQQQDTVRARPTRGSPNLPLDRLGTCTSRRRTLHQRGLAACAASARGAPAAAQGVLQRLERRHGGSRCTRRGDKVASELAGVAGAGGAPNTNVTAPGPRPQPRCAQRQRRRVASSPATADAGLPQRKASATSRQPRQRAPLQRDHALRHPIAMPSKMNRTPLSLGGPSRGRGAGNQRAPGAEHDQRHAAAEPQ